MTSDAHPYDELTPELILHAVESIGYACDGRQLALNSYENRVYQIGLDDRTFLIAKFYRPGRWSEIQIREEHAFAAELVEAELPLVAPLARDGETLFTHAGFRFALFPRRGGRAPELEDLQVAEWMGRLIARIHAVGARRPFTQRLGIDVDSLARDATRAVLASTLIPATLAPRYRRASEDAARALDTIWQEHAPISRMRLHGDCHPGNVLWTEAGPTFVDLDDARNGPAVQDLWMLLTGEVRQRDAVLEGYGQFRDFDFGELGLIPALRLMRQIHYAGWIASRWSDPAFPRAFPYAAEARWWEGHVNDIVEATQELSA